MQLGSLKPMALSKSLAAVISVSSLQALVAGTKLEDTPLSCHVMLPGDLVLPCDVVPVPERRKGFSGDEVVDQGSSQK